LLTPQGEVFTTLRPYQKMAIQDYILHERRGEIQYELGDFVFTLKLESRDGAPTLIMEKEDGSANLITEFDDLTAFDPSTPEARREMIFKHLLNKFNLKSTSRRKYYTDKFVRDGIVIVDSYRFADLGKNDEGKNQILITKERRNVVIQLEIDEIDEIEIKEFREKTQRRQRQQMQEHERMMERKQREYDDKLTHFLKNCGSSIFYFDDKDLPSNSKIMWSGTSVGTIKRCSKSTNRHFINVTVSLINGIVWNSGSGKFVLKTDEKTREYSAHNIMEAISTDKPKEFLDFESTVDLLNSYYDEISEMVPELDEFRSYNSSGYVRLGKAPERYQIDFNPDSIKISKLSGLEVVPPS